MPELDTCSKSRAALGGKSIGCRDRRLKPTARSGKAGLVLLLILVLAAVAALTWMRTPAGDPARFDPRPPTPDPAQPKAAGAGEPAASKRAEIPMTITPALETGRSEGLPRPVAKAFDESRLVGHGHIRGFVQAPPGIEFPTEWVLTVEPSTSLIGREHAETRKLEFHNGEREFDLRELAFGGYMLRASAFGLASGAQHLLLARPADVELYVSMQLAVTAFIEGSVRYEDSTPAIGLELALEPRPAGVRAIAISDSIGHFLFTDVKSGGYTLHFGNPENPVRKPIEVNVSGPAEHLADAIVPKMCELIVRVLDAQGLPARGVKVDGYGDHGGRFDSETNGDGEYRARFLPAGRITVGAQFPDGVRVTGRQMVGIGVLELIQLVRKK